MHASSEPHQGSHEEERFPLIFPGKKYEKNLLSVSEA
jgi:hypothetical protein